MDANDKHLDILYLDEDLVIVNKPSGLLVHRTHLAKHETDAALQRLNHQLGQWVYPVHRLDRATSGVLMFALSSGVARQLVRQFSNHSIDKRYLCLTRGHTNQVGQIDYPLAQLNEKKGRSRFKIAGTEKEAVTHYQTLQHYLLPYPVSKYPTTRCSLVEITPQHGRKHQIRRHFKHLRNPLLGDTRYGCRHHNQLFSSFELPLRLMLHAKSIAFTHPNSGKKIFIEAPIAEDFQQMLEYLEQHDITASQST